MRDYQKECIEVIENHFKTNNKQLIQLPTGAGKTWIFTQYLEKNSLSALIICPSIELKEQIYETSKRFGIDSVSLNFRDNKKFHIITAMTLARQGNRHLLAKRSYDHIVIDEAHHAQAPTYYKFLSRLNSNVKILGCTATPERSDGQSLLNIFDTLTYQKNIYDLITQGFLADIESYRIKTGQNISKRASDFRAIELRELDNDTRNKVIIQTIKENCLDYKTLIFCLNINHSIKVADLLQKEGLRADFIHGKMSKKDRKEKLRLFKRGDIQFLTNCQLLTEGFDEPSIEALVIARPTTSKALYCQMIGRGLRKTSTKDLCRLYEITDNNHKICTFNVAAGKEPEFQREYKKGIRLTELYREVEKLNLNDFVIQKENLDLFANKKEGSFNAVNLFESIFYKVLATNYQRFWLDFYEIKYPSDINFLEAGFLIWKQHLKEKYGYNNRKN